MAKTGCLRPQVTTLLGHYAPPVISQSSPNAITAMIHQLHQLHRRPLLVVWFLGLLAFRFTFLIFTHNSALLSGFLSLLFVLLPALVLRQVGRAVAHREPALPFQKTGGGGKLRVARWKRYVGVVAMGALYLWGLRVRKVWYDPEKLPVGGKYFLAVNFWDNEAIVPAFFTSVFTLAAHLGPQNIFLSIAENDSRDATRALLHSYERELNARGIPYHLRTDDNLRTANRSSNPDQPWLSVVDRMTYMARIRNAALEPLYTTTVAYTRIIFFNDVLWDWRAVMALLQTPGELVCTLDFDASGIYDAWVLQDRCGHPVSSMYPYFWHAADAAAVARREPFEVGVCWNGIASLNATPFLNSTDIAPPLRFPSAKSGCYQSECAALPLAMFAATNPRGPRAVVVPDATVTYTRKWWVWYNVLLRMRAVEWWVAAVERVWGSMWWPVLGQATRWKGLEVKGEVECKVEKWERCDRGE